MPYKNPEDKARWFQENKDRHRIMHKNWRKENPEINKEIERRNRVKRIYGITSEQYDELLAKQNGCCGICKRPKEDFKIRLAIDHDHHTGEIRGLLCVNCNRHLLGRHRAGTGGVELFANASEYLKGGSGWLVPIKKSKRKSRKRRLGTRGSTKGRST